MSRLVPGQRPQVAEIYLGGFHSCSFLSDSFFYCNGKRKKGQGKARHFPIFRLFPHEARTAVHTALSVRGRLSPNQLHGPTACRQAMRRPGDRPRGGSKSPPLASGQCAVCAVRPNRDRRAARRPREPLPASGSATFSDTQKGTVVRPFKAWRFFFGFTGRLSGGRRELYESLRSLQSVPDAIELELAFSEGLHLGMRLALEIFPQGR